MSEQQNLLQTIFVEALEIEDAQQRAAFLSQACGANSGLRREVDELIQAHAAAGKFLPDQPSVTGVREALLSTAPAPGPGVPASIVPVSESPGDRISRYKLLRQIGEGGCGVVYLAEQEEPVRRKVALKVIKLGMDTKQVVARFEAERQALALMDHPSIAQVFDAGATEAGRPYFVMELVRGSKITDYCAENKLSTRERLELFIQVCLAVQHAHQKGIIHRDLKPSNILVTENDGVAVPKVIDFGIAKATEGKLTDQTVFTAFEQFLGTPAYMSPEQAAMTSLDIDTRSDIYSLGVLLYELLTGTTPFDTKELLALGVDELRRTIREKEPVRPSTAIKRTSAMKVGAKQDSSALNLQSKSLSTDLDWIVMKCLEKARSRRYETANGLAADVRRHLNDEPVMARPPSRIYEFQKTVRRHKLGFAATGAIIVTLAAGVIASTWQAVRARRAEKEQGHFRVEAQLAQAKAEAQERIARQQSYANGMLLAYESYETSDFGAVSDLLEQTASWSQYRAGTNSADAIPDWEWRHLQHEIRDEASAVWAKCEGNVHSLSISNDDQWLAAGTKSGQLLLWQISNHELRGTWHYGQDVQCVAFSPGNRLLAAGGVDGTIQILTIPSGELFWRFTATNNNLMEFAIPKQILDLRFSQDGSRLAFCTPAPWSGFQIVRLEDGTISQMPIAEKEAWRAAISPDLNLVARSLAPDGLAFSWPGTNALFQEPVGNRYHTSQGMAISPDGQWLAMPLVDHSIDLWSVKELKRSARLTGHTAAVGALAWSPDNRFLASGGSDQTIIVWEMPNGTLRRRLRGHTGGIDTLVFSLDGVRLYSGGGGDRTIRVWTSWNAAPPPHVVDLPAQAGATRLAPGARYLAVNRQSGLRVFETHPVPKMVRTAELRGVLLWGVSPDGQTVVGADPGSDRCEVWKGYANGLLTLRSSDQGLPNVRAAPSFSRDGRRVALLNTNGTFGIWQVEPWRELARWEGAELHEHGIHFDPPGERVFIACHSKGIVGGDMTTGRLITMPRQQHIDFSPDNKFAVTCVDNSISLWAFGPGEEPQRLRTLSTQKFYTKAIAFSSDGRRAAVGMADGQINLWDIHGGLKVGALKGHRQPIVELGFDPDDHSLVSVSADELRVWRVVQTGR